MKDLELKYHSETGTKPTRQIYASEYDEDTNPMILPDNEDHLIIPTEEYIYWLESLAEKYFKFDLSRYSKAQLEDELHRRKLRELNKLLAIERNKQNPLQ